MGALLIGVALPTAVHAQPSDTPSISEARSRVTSEGLDLAERAAAATQLLQMQSDEATETLSFVLTTPQNKVGRRAVIQAIATYMDDPPKDLAKPLIGLLGQVDASLAPDLAAALGRYDQSEIIKQISKIARDRNEPVARRCHAVLALGYDRTTLTAGQLMELTDASQPELVQQASFKALGTLTALDHYDADRQAWESWWKQNKGLWAKEWTQHLLENFERREARRPARDHELEDLLLESQRALYQANSPEGKPGVLVYMLGKPLAPIRQLGMDLAGQRQSDDLPFDESLLSALRERLTDPVPAIRADAALLLLYESDEPAAALVAARLGEEREQVSAVLSAYLQMMARLPQAEAVDPATDLLNDEALRDDAASALASAFDAGLMKKSQVNRAAKLVRRYIKENAAQTPPAPPVIALLGKVGNKDDWKRIAEWVDHPEASVKKAAAQAWADSDRPLNLLADRISDPTIQPILIAAATRRGDQAYTLNILTDNRPQRDRFIEPWRRALVAMASRAPAEAVLDTVRKLGTLGESSALQVEVLSSAINRPQADTLEQSQLFELLLARGEARLEAGDASTALADFQAVASSEGSLTDAQGDRLGRGQISASLQVGQIDQAFTTARALFGSSPGRRVSPTDDRIVEQFITTAQRFRQEGRKDDVTLICQELRDLLKPAIKPAVGQQLAILEAWVNGSAMVVPPLTAADEAPRGDGEATVAE